ncbi:RNA polymerase sigma factor [Bremerella sp.]|uniref:RNA polymerase sigma factor n=1 Tax=Bremerella sp. TaxID=2795602 RepID=UPI00391ADC18
MSVDIANQSEEALIAGLQAGDPAAFRSVYEHFARRLDLYVRNRCPSEADDLIQQTWLKVWNSRDRFEGGQLGAWIITIARNTIYDHFRKAKPLPLASEMIVVSEMATQTLRLEQEEELAQLRDCSQQLPEVSQRIVREFYNGVSGEKIAAAEDIERSTVYTRVHRALTSLRKCMERKRA